MLMLLITGPLALAHLFIGTYILRNLAAENYGGEELVAAVIILETVLGTAVIVITGLTITKPFRKKRKAVSRTASGFLAFNAILVIVSWTYIVGLAIVSVAYLLEALLVWIIARYVSQEE